MANNDEDSRKRMRGVVGESSNRAALLFGNINYSTLRRHPLVSPPGVPHVPLFGSLETGRAQRALDLATDRRPFSFQYLLNGPDPEDYVRSFDESENINTSDPIGQILASHGDSLKNELSGSVEKLVQAKVADLVKNKEQQLKNKLGDNDFLEKKTKMYREQAEHLMSQVNSMEQKANSLRKTIKEANERSNAKAIEETSGFYYVDPIRLGPVWLDCKKCEKKVAMVMVMPCRHISLCTACVDITRDCPLCRQTMVESVEVYLPYQQA